MWRWLLFALCVFLFIFFPILSLRIIKKTRAVGSEGAHDAGFLELKASILYLQTALPTILFLLGALGFVTYQDVVTKVTNVVQQKVDKQIEKDKVEAWVNEVETYKERVESDANLIHSITKTSEDSISKIAARSFLKLLPKGTIISFKGRRDEIDFEYWAICDGTKGTPNLKDRFILGSTFVQQGGRGGSNSHNHSASTVPRGQVSKRQSLEFPHRDGTVREFQVERHEHSFNGIESPVNVARSEHIPPYYRLMFLMKIK